MQSKESPGDNGSFSVPVNDPLTDGKETVLLSSCHRSTKKETRAKKERFLLISFYFGLTVGLEVVPEKACASALF